MIFSVAMLPGALVAAIFRRRLRWLLLAAGAVFLCVPAVRVASEEVGSTAALTIGQWVGVIAAGAAVFMTIGALPVVTWHLTRLFLSGLEAPVRRGIELRSGAPS